MRFEELEEYIITKGVSEMKAMNLMLKHDFTNLRQIDKYLRDNPEPIIQKPKPNLDYDPNAPYVNPHEEENNAFILEMELRTQAKEMGQTYEQLKIDMEEYAKTKVIAPTDITTDSTY